MRCCRLMSLIFAALFNADFAFSQSSLPPLPLPGSNALPVNRSAADEAAVASLYVPHDPLHKVWQDEATLRSVAAVTEDRLVAVGDRGVVLVSDDAGRSWHRLPLPTSANLYDVQFSGQTGWIVGGWIGKHTGSSYSVVFFSNDGGRQWQVLSSQGLPRLIGLIVQGSRLISWGDYSAALGTSTFESLDGGFSWRPAIQGLTHASAAASDLTGQLLAIDRLGKSAKSSGAVQPISEPSSQIKTATATGTGWLAAGESGQLISSQDGISWSDVDLPISRSIQNLCCWNSIAGYGNHLWMVGSPGTVVFHSPDGGLTWSSHPTGQSLPLNRICFIDANRGWAVGAQGTIIATRDGGRTWYPQRTQPKRAALLSVVSHSACVPWPALVATVWDHGQCAAVVSLRHDEPITVANFKPNNEVVNAHAATQFGLSDYQICHVAEQGGHLEVARLALQILVWRPDVILSSISPDLHSEVKLPSVVGEAIQTAGSEEFEKAAQQLHLTKWQVKKWVSVTDSRRAEYSEQSQRVLRQSGLAIWDILLALPDEDLKRCDQVEMRTVWTRSQNRTSHTELMGGIAQHSETRLKDEITGLGNYQLVMGRLHRQRMLDELAKADSTLISDEAWFREFRFFAQSLPIRESSENLIQLAESLFERRQLGRGQLVLDWLLRDPSASEDARRWARWRRLQWMGSQEWQAWVSSGKRERSGATSDVNVVTAAAVNPNSASLNSVRLAPWTHTPFDSVSQESVEFGDKGNDSAGQVVIASAEQSAPGLSRPIPQDTGGTGSTTWIALAESVFQQDPLLRFQPDVMMQLAGHYRQTGETQLMAGLLNELLQRPELVSWYQAAKQEMALFQDRRPNMKWSVNAEYAHVAPRLDGEFDERIWQSDSAMLLQGLNGPLQDPTRIRWAYDADYLYLALQCPSPAKREMTSVMRQRYYDADLVGTDHIVLTIDTDRDYSTVIELAIAENGLTYERCAGFREYNPKWYVQVTPLPTQWRAEVAIPLSELTQQDIQPGTVWAVSARRISPENGLQSWSQIKTHRRILEASGLLMFQ